MLDSHWLVVGLIALISAFRDIDKTYIRRTPTDVLLGQMFTLSGPTYFQCARRCLLQHLECEGFQFDTVSSTCLLYEKICFGIEAEGPYFGNHFSTEPLIDTLLAQGKPANMSTGGASAYRGNDGVYPTENYPGASFHTSSCNDVHPWWRVDLLDPYCVTAVYFMNKGLTHAGIWQRAKNIVVTVSLLEEDIMDTGDNRCGYIDGVAQQLHNLVTCEIPQVGRFVQLQMRDTNCLHFYEVEVHGH